MDTMNNANHSAFDAEMTVTICRECGALIPADSRFCTNCGAALAKPSPSEDPAFAPAAEETPAFAPTEPELSAPSAPAFAPVAEETPAFAPAEPEQSSTDAPAFTPAEEPPARKDGYAKPTSAFADGLPEWDIEPPQILVRRR